ncbi:RraA-like protein [Auriculariales sp. MPI-PUGE-AT-0066]|nr:RraA-like protein [Auriculariales sp. MPI-PUGE-AT-0066]
MSIGAYSTCELSDALLKLKVAHGGYIPDINMVSPDDRGVRVAGPAYTVRMCLLTDETAPPKPKDHFVDVAPSGSVMVISVPPQAKNAVWGGLMTAGAQARGVLGVVISGRSRDLAEHLTAKFPVFARGNSTLGQGPFTRPAELNVPLTISPVGDAALETVTVHPGDWIVADCDGVVCVPANLVTQVCELAATGRQVDDRCMADIRAGKGITATFSLHRG